MDIISRSRGEKTNHNVSLKTPIRTLNLSVNEELKDAINKAIKDFKATLFIENLIMNDQDTDYTIHKIELNLDTENKKELFQ